jgi:hypothetical protein
MSKKSNVHPDHYKTAGRSRPGDDLLHARETQAYAQSQQDSTRHAPAAAPKMPRKARQRGPSRKRREAGHHETKQPAGGMVTNEEALP